MFLSVLLLVALFSFLFNRRITAESVRIKTLPDISQDSDINREVHFYHLFSFYVKTYSDCEELWGEKRNLDKEKEDREIVEERVLNKYVDMGKIIIGIDSHEFGPLGPLGIDILISRGFLNSRNINESAIVEREGLRNKKNLSFIRFFNKITCQKEPCPFEKYRYKAPVTLFSTFFSAILEYCLCDDREECDNRSVEHCFIVLEKILKMGAEIDFESIEYLNKNIEKNIGKLNKLNYYATKTNQEVLERLKRLFGEYSSIKANLKKMLGEGEKQEARKLTDVRIKTVN